LRSRGRWRGRALGLAALALLGLASGVAAQPGASTESSGGEHGLVKITLTPPHVRRSMGEPQYLAAIGTFADGSSRNLTQRLTYRSSNPKVAVAKNEPGHKSRIDHIAIGRATISAVDPLTGLTSTASNSDVEVRVVGRLERITMKPTAAQQPIGGFQHFTVTGHYPGGATRNLTQQVRYLSSDPAVALARNRRGDRSRVEAVASGTATISAFHAESKLSTDDSGTSATLTVIGKLERVTLAPPHPRKAPGEVQNYTATGHYAGGISRNLTQRVEYSTSDASVATAPNAQGNRSRIEAVKPGTVTIAARDPATGISSSDGGGDAALTVYDPAAPREPRTGAAKAPAASSALPKAGAGAGVGAVCGDASGDGALGFGDPVWIALGAFGVTACPASICDVDADGQVTTGDALAVGWVVAGYDRTLTCR
jgi:uncharacterized protein YjdB